MHKNQELTYEIEYGLKELLKKINHIQNMLNLNLIK